MTQEAFHMMSIAQKRSYIDSIDIKDKTSPVWACSLQFAVQTKQSKHIAHSYILSVAYSQLIGVL